jgi:hypothetical protein
VKEEFLRIYLQVHNLTPEEMAWAYDFLDAVVDPNVALDFGNLKKITDSQDLGDNWHIRLNNKTTETVLLASVPGIRLNVFFKEKIGRPVFYDGKHSYDGSFEYNGNYGFYDAVRYAAVPAAADRMGHGDAATLSLKLLFTERMNRGKFAYDGTHSYDGTVDYSGGRSITDDVSVKAHKTENIRDAARIGDHVHSGIAAGPLADAARMADRINSGITAWLSADAALITGRVKSGIAVGPLADAARMADHVHSGIRARPLDTIGIKTNISIKVQKSTLYNGEIYYDGSHTYGGYTQEEAHYGTG